MVRSNLDYSTTVLLQYMELISTRLQKMSNALHYLLDNIFIRFGTKLYRQIVGIPMDTNCAPLVADLFCFVMRETSCCLC